MNIVFRGGTVIDVATAARAAADIGINLERRRAAFVAPAMVRAVGSISMRGLDEYDASNFHIVGRIQPIKPGNFAELLFYKRDRQIDWKVPDIEKEFPPDAILSLGKWIKGAGVVPKR